MWHEITNNNDLENFMETVCFFHDSCIKEMKYVSGAYVNENLSMYPVNEQRILKVVIQRQFSELSMIELEFKGLEYLKLFPVDDQYTCEILDSTMFFKDGYIYWCDQGGLSETDIDTYAGTVICALEVKWRAINNHMGQKEFFSQSMCMDGQPETKDDPSPYSAKTIY